MTIAFLQPFGVHSPGGGPRILRALVQDAPTEVISVCMSPAPPPPTTSVEELHVPVRPTFGRLEPTRLHRYLGVTAVPLEPVVRRRLSRMLRERGAERVHLVAHDATFWPAYKAARAARLPVALTVHDHLDYNMRDRPERAIALRRLGRVWREAEERFVISDAIAEEYCNRFGDRRSVVVTDGLDEVRPPVPAVEGRCTVYFMGAFHMSYRRNLEALLRGMELFQRSRPDLSVRLKMRCGDLPGGLPGSPIQIEPLPFADEATIRRDMEDADLLWLPLPFGEEHASFVRFSLSTKLVTYLGSGLPILYHGPPDAAAARLLRATGAGVEATSLEAEAIRDGLADAVENRARLAERAGDLARREFMLEVLRDRFWSVLSPAKGTETALH